MGGKAYTQAEILDIVLHYHLVPKPDHHFAEKYGRTPVAIAARVADWRKEGRFGERPQDTSYSHRYWTSEQIALLHAYWRCGTRTDAWVAERIGKSAKACLEKAYKLGLRSDGDVLSIADVRRIFRISWHRAFRWVRTGMLRANCRNPNSCKGHRYWMVRAVALEAFIKRHPEEYDPKYIDRDRFPRWRALAEQACNQAIEKHGEIMRVRKPSGGYCWKTSDIAYLLREWPVVPRSLRPTAAQQRKREEIAHKLNRSVISCTNRWYALRGGAPHGIGSGSLWSKQDTAYLLRYWPAGEYPHHISAEQQSERERISARLGRSLRACAHQYRAEKLKRDQAIKRGPGRPRKIDGAGERSRERAA